jgi:hypothetical protein
MRSQTLTISIAFLGLVWRRKYGVLIALKVIVVVALDLFAE